MPSALRSPCFSILISITGILSSSDGNVIRRNAALLPTYSFVIGLIALLGYMAIAVGVDHDPAHAAGFARYGPNYAVPALFLSSFSSWFVGIAFAGIASVRSYPQRSCQLPERNLYEEFIHPDCTEGARSHHGEDRLARGEDRCCGVYPGATARLCDPASALGGIWIIQLLPAILLGLYTR